MVNISTQKQEPDGLCEPIRNKAPLQMSWAKEAPGDWKMVFKQSPTTLPLEGCAPLPMNSKGRKTVILMRGRFFLK